MSALLLVTGLLLAGSVWAKWRAGKRMGTGVHPLTLLELVVGVAALGLSGAGPAAAGAGRLVVPAGVLLLFASSGVFALRLRDERRRRAHSESRRLEAYVRYLHTAQPEGDGEGAEPRPDRPAPAPDADVVEPHD